MTDAPIAGWYPDPRDAAARWRWWDGRDWTHETAPRIVAEIVAPVRRGQDWGWASASATPTQLAVPSNNPNTPWIWLLAFSVYIAGAAGGVLQGVGLVLLGRDAATSQLVGGASLLLALVPLWVFADLDGRALRRRGFGAPSVLWMLLLPPLVYFVVRARKLRAVGARSKGPETALLIVIAVQVLAGIAAAILAYSLLQALGGPAIG